MRQASSGFTLVELMVVIVLIGVLASMVHINLGDGATTGAGSTVTADVPANTLAVGRAKQRNIDGWKRPVKGGRMG